MLTLEQAIKPILKEENVPGYGPVSVREGKHHWFILFGFDGETVPGDVPYAIDKDSGKIDLLPMPLPLRGGNPSAIERELAASSEVQLV